MDILLIILCIFMLISMGTYFFLLVYRNGKYSGFDNFIGITVLTINKILSTCLIILGVYLIYEHFS